MQLKFFIYIISFVTFFFCFFEGDDDKLVGLFWADEQAIKD